MVVNICRSVNFGSVVGFDVAVSVDVYFDCLRHDGERNSISFGIGLGVIGVASIGDPNVENDISSGFGLWISVSFAFLTLSYSSSSREDSSSRDIINGVGADGMEILVSSYFTSVLGQQVSVFMTGPGENPLCHQLG